MGTLREQVKESFFNPILHIFPILIFIVVGYFFDEAYAWVAALVPTVFLIFYVHKFYVDVFKNYMLCISFSVANMLLMSISAYLLKDTFLADASYELAFFVGFTTLYLFKNQAIKFSRKFAAHSLPMKNNELEFYRTIRIFIFLAGGYLILFFVFALVDEIKAPRFISILNAVYVTLVVLIVIYEFIRVSVIRKNLMKEIWIPILNSEGKSIGSIQQLASLLDEKKYIHPVIRGLYVKDNKICLQHSASGDIIGDALWDSFLVNHIKTGQTADECIQETAHDCYNVKDVTSFFLTKYMMETPFEYQNSLVFTICNFTGEIQPHPDYIKQIKWWTFQQIKDNLNTGIFTEQFLKEYEFLNRSGMIESGKFSCDFDLTEETEE